MIYLSSFSPFLNENAVFEMQWFQCFDSASEKTISVTATDADGYKVTDTHALTIAAKPELGLELSLPNGKQDLDYGAHKLVATGSTGFTYAVTGLPDGLTLAGDTISGTPSVAKTFKVTVTATDKDGYVIEKSQDIVISNAPVINVTPDTLPAGKVGLEYGPHTLSAVGGSAPYTYLVSDLPEGLTINAGTSSPSAMARTSKARVATGNVITGVPTKAGTSSIKITITDGDGYTAVQTRTIVIAEAPKLELDLSKLTGGKAGVDYGSHQLATTGGTAPYYYAVTGLPEGLSLNKDSGVVSGTPAKAGTFEAVITVRDAENYTQSKPWTFIIADPLMAQNHDLTVMAGTTGSVDLAQGASGDTVSAAAITAQPDATSGRAWVESGNKAQMLYFAASSTYAGTTQLSYKLSGKSGASASAIVTIHVIARPDPSKDAEVIGLVNAQVETANRMAQMQIRNFQQRLEQLHGEGECRQDSIGLNVGLDGAQLNPKMAQVCTQRELSLWTAGEVNMGKSSSEVNTKDKKLDHTSIGVSGGVDYRFSPSFIGGIGFGYGKDTTDVGQNGTQSRASMFSLAAYGSYRPGKNFFLDGVIGYGWLNFESDRFVTATGGMASGERKGQQLFGSVTLGYDYRNEAWLVSPYIRGEAAHTKLGSFSETGAGIYNLTYGDQTADLLSATIGLRGEYTIPTSWGTLKPKARVEYTHDFAGSSRVKLGYTDIGGLLPYTIDARSSAKDSIRIEAGFDASINGGWSAGLDYSTQIGTAGGKLSHSIRWKLSKKF
ncbi:autotransporter family protein [Brucella pituitosa]|uniref:autotransporter family protein n=1 Tax=Brucella pituitosa TaxID=571256 RepID=UPI0012FD9416|nr:autotransporter domain-containing protein [Brucella pituitosa]